MGFFVNKNQQKMNQTCQTPTNKKGITFDLEEYTRIEREEAKIRKASKRINLLNITPKKLDFERNIFGYSRITLYTKQDNTSGPNSALEMKKMCSFGIEMGTKNEINYDSKLLKSSSMMNIAC